MIELRSDFRHVEREVEELREKVTSLSRTAEASAIDSVQVAQQVKCLQNSGRVLDRRVEELAARVDHCTVKNETTEGKIEELQKQLQQVHDQLSRPMPKIAPEEPESAFLLESFTPVPTKQDPGTT